MHIVDRRLNPNNKSLENRQRFLRRAKALVQGAVKKSSEGRGIKDVLGGGEVSMQELASLYAMLANGGVLKPLRFRASDADALSPSDALA